MNKKNLIIIGTIVVIVVIAMRYLSAPTDTSGTLATDVSTPDSTDAKYIYSILQKMAQVRLEDSIFSKNTFLNLKDNTVTFNPQESGRNNPFSPVGSDSGAARTTSTTTR